MVRLRAFVHRMDLMRMNATAIKIPIPRINIGMYAHPFGFGVLICHLLSFGAALQGAAPFSCPNQLFDLLCTDVFSFLLYLFLL